MILFTDKKVFTAVSSHTERVKNLPTVCTFICPERNASWQNVQTVTDGSSRRVTNGRQNTSLIRKVVS